MVRGFLTTGLAVRVAAQMTVDGPWSYDEQPQWLEQLKQKRSDTQQSIGWDGKGVFDQLPWTQTSYVQP